MNIYIDNVAIKEKLKMKDLLYFELKKIKYSSTKLKRILSTTSSCYFLLISTVFNISFCVVLVLYLNLYSLRWSKILFIYLNLYNLYLAYPRNFLYSYMIIGKFIFRVFHSIISQATIIFLVIWINSRNIKLEQDKSSFHLSCH